MQLDGPRQSRQFSVSPRRRWITPSSASRLARSSCGGAGILPQRPRGPLGRLGEFPLIHQQEGETRPRPQAPERWIGGTLRDRLQLGQPVGDPAPRPGREGRADLLDRPSVRDRSGEPRGRPVSPRLEATGAEQRERRQRPARRRGRGRRRTAGTPRRTRRHPSGILPAQSRCDDQGRRPHERPGQQDRECDLDRFPHRQVPREVAQRSLSQKGPKTNEPRASPWDSPRIPKDLGNRRQAAGFGARVPGESRVIYAALQTGRGCKAVGLSTGRRSLS